MREGLTISALAAALALAAPAMRAQRPASAPPPAPPPRHGLWIGFGLGGGQVERWSEQEAPVHATTVTASLRFGVVVAPTVRLGVEANGWLLEPSDLNDPTRGETVNATLLIAEVYPWPSRNLFVKGGYGWGAYHNKHPESQGSHAFGAVSLGAGYDVRVGRNLFVTVAADYTRGPAGSVLPPLSPVTTGRAFRGWDLVVGFQYH